MVGVVENQLFWHEGAVDGKARGALFGHKACTLWFTGLSGSGKSTVAVALERTLVTRRIAAYRLDGDNVRLGLCSDLTFSPEDRRENIRRVAEVAKLMNDAGLIVLAAFVSPLAGDRALAASIVGPSAFLEVFVDTPLEVCEARDPKGLYKRARAGAVKDFTGISAPFEAPRAPALSLVPEDGTPVEQAALVLSHLETGNWIKTPQDAT